MEIRVRERRMIDRIEGWQMGEDWGTTIEAEG